MPENIVEISSGKIRGNFVNSSYSFKGIPYGGATGWMNRFHQARKPGPWAGVRDAVNYGARSPQRPGLMDRLAGSGGSTVKEIQSEDCLVLNVWTPALEDGRKRPVMFCVTEADSPWGLAHLRFMTERTWPCGGMLSSSPLTTAWDR